MRVYHVKWLSQVEGYGLRQFTIKPGGSAANTIYGLAKLGVVMREAKYYFKVDGSEFKE